MTADRGKRGLRNSSVAKCAAAVNAAYSKRPAAERQAVCVYFQSLARGVDIIHSYGCQTKHRKTIPADLLLYGSEKEKAPDGAFFCWRPGADSHYLHAIYD